MCLCRDKHNRDMNGAVRTPFCLHPVLGEQILLAKGKPFLLPLGVPARIIQTLGKTPSLKINIYICGFLLFPRELFGSGPLSQQLLCSHSFPACSCSSQTSGAAASPWDAPGFSYPMDETFPTYFPTLPVLAWIKYFGSESGSIRG